MKLIKSLLAFSLLAACAPTQVHTPDGGIGYEVKCRTDKSTCYRKAGKICKQAGYKVVTDNNSETENGGLGAAGGYVSASISRKTHYSIIIQCNGQGSPDRLESSAPESEVGH